MAAETGAGLACASGATAKTAGTAGGAGAGSTFSAPLVGRTGTAVDDGDTAAGAGRGAGVTFCGPLAGALCAAGGVFGGITSEPGIASLSAGAVGFGFCLLPSDLSKPLVSNVGIGKLGCVIFTSSFSGSTRVGVTITTNSVVEWVMFFDLKSAPRMGMLAIPGVLLSRSVVR